MDALWLRTRGECGSGMAGSSEDQSLRCSPRPSPSPAQHHSSRGGGQGDSRPGHLVLLDKCLLELPKSHQGHLQDVLHLHGMWTSAVLCCQVPVIQMRAGISFWFRASQLSQVSFGESAGRELAGRSSVYPYTLFKKKSLVEKIFCTELATCRPCTHQLSMSLPTSFSGFPHFLLKWTGGRRHRDSQTAVLEGVWVLQQLLMQINQCMDNPGLGTSQGRHLRARQSGRRCPEQGL